FMKREFGRKLIEEYLAKKVELSHVIDTSGAFIPGHGTPTVILVGRRQPPRASRIRALLGIKGEPSQPPDPAQRLAWRAIRQGLGEPAARSPYVTVTELPRDRLARYPWSLSGGGALDLQSTIDASSDRRLRGSTSLIGFMALTREDDAYFIDPATARRRDIAARVRPVGEGEGVRDWLTDAHHDAVFPYSDDGSRACAAEDVRRFLWPNRRLLEIRRALSGTHEERGLPWYTYSDFHPDRWSAPRSIAFAFVQTHNHFVFDRGGTVFNRSAPVIKLPATAGEDEHLLLLGLLNSSTACFWLKQVSQPKGGSGIGRGIQPEAWEERYEFTGT